MAKNVYDGRLFDRRVTGCSASVDDVFATVCALGGDGGWPALNFLWQLRGLIDRMIGGVGMRRGHARELRVGAPFDFWRVEALDPPRLLRLNAEMKLPGSAWLQFEIVPDSEGSRIEQTALFDPHGLLGYLYWYASKPIHSVIFSRLVRSVRDRAQAGFLDRADA